MDVDETRSDQQALGIDLTPARSLHLADFDDAAPAYGDVTDEGRSAGPIDDAAPTNHQIMHGGLLVRSSQPRIFAQVMDLHGA